MQTDILVSNIYVCVLNKATLKRFLVTLKGTRKYIIWRGVEHETVRVVLRELKPK